MILRFIVGLCLFALATTPSVAATPQTGDSTSKVNQPQPTGVKASSVEAGWIYLIGSDGPQGIAKVGKNVTLCGDVHTRVNARELTAVPGVGVVAALSQTDYGDDNNLLSKQEFGDCEVYLEFMLSKGSNSGVKLQQRYEIQFYDSYGKEKPSGTDCGGIYPHWVYRRSGEGLDYIDQGVPPKVNAAKPAGQWQTLHIVFTAPRFDEQGKKTKNCAIRVGYAQ